MRQILFTRAELSDRKIERLMGTKIARALGAIGWSALVCALVLLVVVGARSTRHQMLEKTTVIERLATKLARTERIAPGTQDEVAQLLRRPDYDCRQIACDALIEKRNAAARATLETILAKHSVPATLAASK